jgi:DNA-binding GntR family transcriptional regulator
MIKIDKSLADGTHRRLRRDIIDGRLQPGSKLKLEGLAAGYSVGMSPLREALSRLIGESLVISESQRGFWVAPLSIEEWDDLTRVRLLIECEALSLSIQHGDAAWEARVRAVYEELSRIELQNPPPPGVAPNPELLNDWEQRNSEFHEVLVEACRSPVLIKMREWLYNQSERYRRLSVGVSIGTRDVHEEHAAIFEATLQRNVLKACRLLESHLHQTSLAVRRVMVANSTSDATRG